MFRIDALPREKKTIKILWRDRLNFSTEPVNGESMNSRQQPAITPFLFRRVGMKFATQNKTFRFEPEECSVDFEALQAQYVCQLTNCDWSANFHSSANQFANRAGAIQSLRAIRFLSDQFRLECSLRINGLKTR